MCENGVRKPIRLPAGASGNREALETLTIVTAS